MVVNGVEDLLRVLVLLRKLELDERSHINVDHLELLLKLGRSLLATAASRSRQDNAFHFTIN